MRWVGVALVSPLAVALPVPLMSLLAVPVLPVVPLVPAPEAEGDCVLVPDVPVVS